MANIRKSFNFRNGVQVDDDNFIVNANGLVGIGTSIPREFLDVHGTAKITGLVTATNLTITGVSTFHGDVKIGSGVTLYASTGIVSATAFYGDASNMTGVEQVAVDGWIVNAGNISTTSKVGIGTTLPRSQLDVVGGVIVSGIVTASGFGGYQVLVGTESSAIKTFSVNVASKTSNHRYTGSGSANAYFIDGIESPFLTLLPGKTYIFDQSDSSNSGHRLSFYLEADRTTPYDTNVTTTDEIPGTSGSYTQIIVTDTTPVVLHYQSLSSAYMGNAAQFNSNIVNTPYQITTLAGISATTGVVTAYSFSGFGTNIQGINATNITNGTLSNSRLAQNVSISGIISAPSGIITSLTSTNLNNTGIATLGIVTVSQLYVSGVTTSLQGFVGNVTGIASTALSLSGTPNITVANINNTGIATLGNVISSNINNTGIATLGIVTVSQLYVSGVTTSLQGFVGNVTGIASTALSLSGTPNITVGNVDSVGIINSVFSSIAISTVSTRLYAERIGVGTNSPSGDIHIRRNGQSRLQVTSDTAEAIVAVGRTSYGALIYGNTLGAYPYSNSKTLDIVNYDTGNLNYYLNYELAGVGTGNFNWFHSLNGNNPLMSLTYRGNLGIGVSNPTNKLEVSGGISASSLSLSGNISATGAGTSTSVRQLYVYGGKSQILNSDGTQIFPILTEDKNLNIISGISTFYDIDVANDIYGNNGIFNQGIGINTTNIENSIFIQDGAIGIGTDNVPSDLRFSCLGTPEIPFGAAFDYVGIGTTTVENPNTNLYVVGNSEFYGGVGIGTTNPGTANLAIVNSSSIASLSIGQNVDGTGSNHLGFWYGFGGSKANIFTSNGNMRFDVDGAGGSASSFQFGRGFGTTYAVIGNTGNLGIGTTTPTSKLHVVGDARITGVTTSQNGFTSGIGVTNPVKITVSGNTLTFNVVGVGSTSLTLY